MNSFRIEISAIETKIVNQHLLTFLLLDDYDYRIGSNTRTYDSNFTMQTNKKKKKNMQIFNTFLLKIIIYFLHSFAFSILQEN